MTFQLRVLAYLLISSLVIIPAIAADNIVSNTDSEGAGTGMLTSVINRTIAYQGILKNNTGMPVPDNTYNLTFRIYKSSSGGSSLWISSSIPVTTSGGLFITPVGPIALPFDTTYYISVQVQGDIEMTRQMMTMSPYSAYADTANYAFKSDTARYALNGGVSHWNVSNSVISTDNLWGLSKGNSGSALLGDSVRTMVNLGINSVTGDYSSTRSYCTITGGKDNFASGHGGVISGGFSNYATGDSGVVTGGSHNDAYGICGFVGGGRGNGAGDYASVSGGQGNQAGPGGFIGGGSHNNAYGYGYEIVCGGVDNRAYGRCAIVAGGEADSALDIWSTVGGGYQNAARSHSSVVGGGYANKAAGLASVISGGSWNSTDNQFTSVCGGEWNSNKGSHSTILGGQHNTIADTAATSIVFGIYSRVYTASRAVFFNGNFSGYFGINRDDAYGIQYPLHVGTNASNGNGAYLSSAGVWTNSSSRTFKENFTPFDGSELLRKISALSVTTYNYKNSTEKHIGPVAEEFVGAFDTGVIRESDGKRDDQYLAGSDVAGVALAGVKELLNLINQLKDENSQLKKQNADFERRLSSLENR
jgi:hypothetical protein